MICKSIQIVIVAEVCIKKNYHLQRIQTIKYDCIGTVKLYAFCSFWFIPNIRLEL